MLPIILALSCAKSPPLPMVNLAAEGNVDALSVSARRGASVDEADSNGITPLIIAAYSGRLDAVKWLLDAGADPNLRNRDGETALFSGMNARNADEVVAMLLAGGADPNVVDASGRTALHWAAALGHTGAAQPLIDAGSRLDAVDRDGHTPLHLAAGFDHAAMVPVLLPHAPQEQVAQSMLIATGKGHVATVGSLLDAGVPLNITLPGNQMFPLLAAAAYGQANVVSLLLDRGASVDAVGADGVAPLGLAAYSGHLAVVMLLIDAGADVNHLTRFRGSALRAAADQGHLKVCERLVDAGADASIVDVYGRTALDDARDNGHDAVVTFLGSL